LLILSPMCLYIWGGESGACGLSYLMVSVGSRTSHDDLTEETAVQHATHAIDVGCVPLDCSIFTIPKMARPGMAIVSPHRFLDESLGTHA